MSFIKVGTNFNIDIEFTAPSFGRRLAAWIIDAVVLYLYAVVASEILEAIAHGVNATEEDGGWTIKAVQLTLFLPLILYHLLLETLVNGQSIGKMLTGIRVVSENGGRPSLGQLIIRWLIRTSDYMVVIIVIVVIIGALGVVLSAALYGALALAFGLLVTDLVLVNSRKQQRLGDILAHTVLIRTRQKEHITDTVFLEVEDSYVPQFPQIMQLSDRDMNSLKGILDTVRKHRDFNMAAMAADKIKKHLKIDTYLEPEEFLAVLLKDYNYLSAN